ncbi:hypothetical protein JOM56_002556 [Amanita muscaria]
MTITTTVHLEPSPVVTHRVSVEAELAESGMSPSRPRVVENTDDYLTPPPPARTPWKGAGTRRSAPEPPTPTGPSRRNYAVNPCDDNNDPLDWIERSTRGMRLDDAGSNENRPRRTVPQDSSSTHSSYRAGTAGSSPSPRPDITHSRSGRPSGMAPSSSSHPDLGYVLWPSDHEDIDEGPKGKFYVIARGRSPGVYSDWSIAGPLVLGVKGSLYKKYRSLKKAEYVFRKCVRRGIVQQI